MFITFKISAILKAILHENYKGSKIFNLLVVPCKFKVVNARLFQ